MSTSDLAPEQPQPVLTPPSEKINRLGYHVLDMYSDNCTYQGRVILEWEPESQTWQWPGPRYPNDIPKVSLNWKYLYEHYSNPNF